MSISVDSTYSRSTRVYICTFGCFENGKASSLGKLPNSIKTLIRIMLWGFPFQRDFVFVNNIYLAFNSKSFI